MDNQNQTASLPPIGQLFSQSWQTFTQSMLSLFLLNVLGIAIYIGLAVAAFLVFILSGAGSFLLKNGLQGIATTLTTMSGSTITILVVIAAVFGLIYLIVGSALQISSILLVDSQGKTSLGSAFKKSLALIIPLFLVSILTFVLTFGALFVFVLPAILFYFLLIFVQLEVVLNNKRWLGAVKRSVLVVSKNFGAIFIRLILLVLLYLGYTILVNLISKIGPETEVLTGIISFVINLLLGWFALAYQITLYKQARIGLDNQEGKSIIWMWIVAIIGWLIAVGVFFMGYKAISSGILNNLIQKTASEQLLNSESSTLTAEDLVKDANSKIQEYIQLQNKGNLTDIETQRKINLLTEALSEYKQATEKDPLYIDAWQSLAVLNHKLGDAVTSGSLEQVTLYNEAVNAYYNLGQVYLQKGQKDQAKTAFETGLQIVPSSNTALKTKIQQALDSV